MPTAAVSEKNETTLREGEQKDQLRKTASQRYAASRAPMEDETMGQLQKIAARTFQVGDRVTTSGFPGTVTNIYEAPKGVSSGLYVVRLERGTCCVGGSELVLVEAARA